MKLIDNWRAAWRYLSVQIASGAVLFGMLPQDQQAGILAALRVPASWLPAILGALFIVGRLVQQHPAAPAAAGDNTADAAADDPGA